MIASPRFITALQSNEVFVFGSNLSGIHGAGAAKQALKWGARMGYGIGMFGQTYAIPTVGVKIKDILSIEQIAYYVDGFIYDARMDNKHMFLVTEIGCGLAGYEPKDIAPLFGAAKYVDNIRLPKRFINLLTH